MPKPKRCSVRRTLSFDSYEMRAINPHLAFNICLPRSTMEIDICDRASNTMIRAPSNARDGRNKAPKQNCNSDIVFDDQAVNAMHLEQSQARHISTSASQAFPRAVGNKIFRINTQNYNATYNPGTSTESELPLVHSTFDHIERQVVQDTFQKRKQPVVQRPGIVKPPRYRSRDRKRKAPPMMTALDGQRMVRKRRCNSVPYFKPSKITSIEGSGKYSLNRGRPQSSTVQQVSKPNQNAETIEIADDIAKESTRKGGNETQAEHSDVNSKINTRANPKPPSKKTQRQNARVKKQKAERESKLANTSDSSAGGDLCVPVQNLSIFEQNHVQEEATQQIPQFRASLMNLCRDNRLRRPPESLNKDRIESIQGHVGYMLRAIRELLNVPAMRFSDELSQAGKALTEYLNGEGTLEGNIAPFQYFSYTFMAAPVDAVQENHKIFDQYWKLSKTAADALSDPSLTKYGVAVSGTGRMIVVTIVTNRKS